MTTRRTDFEQARANALKTVRAAVRLKHSIAADEELNRLLPEFEKQFTKSFQNGVLQSPVDIKKVLGV